ncbi:hypothetical protein DM558_03900 [Entomomonas moraniae]|uniref:Uncharacterized protein n=1 Tax=Entomomonas moraniae TaxID=2213226 RepID=A0A3Q9JHU6_9GAMM|nr:hypothetical protein DM558_03900 [Entomomonas moraniae]
MESVFYFILLVIATLYIWLFIIIIFGIIAALVKKNMRKLCVCAVLLFIFVLLSYVLIKYVFDFIISIHG